MSTDTSAATLVVETPESQIVLITDNQAIQIVSEQGATDLQIVLRESNGVQLVSEASEKNIALETTPELFLITQGEQGPPGRDGAVGASTAAYTAALSLGGHRVVTPNPAGNAVYADNTIINTANAVLGLTVGAAAAGDTVAVQHGGEITEPSWTWTPNNPIYLGINGLLTQTPPTNPSAYSLIIGFPITATKMYIGIREPIFLI